MNNPYNEFTSQGSFENPYAEAEIPSIETNHYEGTNRALAALYLAQARNKGWYETQEMEKANPGIVYDMQLNADQVDRYHKVAQIEDIVATGDAEQVKAVLETPDDPLRPLNVGDDVAYQVAQARADVAAYETGDIDSTVDLQQRAYAMGHMLQSMSRLKDQGSWWSGAIDFVTDFAIGDDIFDINGFLNRLQFDSEESSVLVPGDPKRRMEELKSHFNSMNPGEQLNYFNKVLYPAALEETKDPTEAAAILEYLIKPDASWINFEQSLAGLDIALLVGGLAKGVIKGLKAGASVKQVTRLAKSDHIVDWLQKAMNDPELAGQVGSTPQELRNTFSTMRTVEDFDKFPDPKVAEAVITSDLNQKLYAHAEKVALWADNLGFTVDEARMAADAKARAIEQANAGINTITVDQASITSKGFMADVDYINGGIQRQVFEFNVSDVDGVFSGVGRNRLGNIVLDPETKFGSDEYIVRAFTNASDARAITHTFAGRVLKGIKASYKKSKTKDQLLEALKQGNPRPGQQGKVYTWNELHALGIDNQGKAAYFQIRNALDAGWNSINAAEIRSYRINDYKKLSIGNDNWAAKEITANFDDKLVALDRLGNTNIITRQSITGGRLAANRAVVHLKKPMVIGDNVYRQAVVDRAYLSDWRFSDEAVKKIEGYYPIVRKDVNWVIRKNIVKRVGGTGDKVPIGHETLSTFSNKKLADAELAALQAANPNDEFVLLADREYGLGPSIEGHGYQFIGTGSRSSRNIPHDGKVDFPTENPLQSTARYYQMMANRGVLAEWKAGVKKRLVNTVLSRGVKGNPAEVTFDNWREYTNLPSNSSTYKALDQRADYISEMLHIKTPGEMKAETAMWKLSGWLDYKADAMPNQLMRKGTQFLANTSRKMGDMDVPSFLRAVTFHPLLGMGSVAQLVMQAQGMIIPFSAHPGLFVKNIDNIIGMAVLDARLGGKVNSKALEGLSRTTSDEILHMYSMWDKTGFREAVMHNDDLRQAALGTSLLGTKLDKFNSVSGYFFKTGELWNRRGAFAVAYAKVAKKMGVKKIPITPENIREVKNTAYDMMTNLTSANAGQLQKGYAGVITQFQQVWMKGLTNFAPFARGTLTRKGGLTNAERSRVLLGQVALFGAAGIPLGDVLLDAIGNFYNVDDPTQADAQLVEASFRGLLGLMSDDYSFSKYAHIQLEGMDYWRLLRGGIDWKDFVANRTRIPFGTVAGRIGDAAQATSAAIGVTLDNLWEQEAQMNPEQIGDAFWEALKSIARISTSLSTIEKINLYDKYSKIVANSGTYILDKDEKSIDDYIALAIGLNFKEAEDIWTLREAENERQIRLKDNLKLFMGILQKNRDKYISLEDMVRDNAVVAAKFSAMSFEDQMDLERMFHNNEQDALYNSADKEIMDKAIYDNAVQQFVPSIVKMQAE